MQLFEFGRHFELLAGAVAHKIPILLNAVKTSEDSQQTCKVF